jgi:ABC-type antimicrobial peptide transport system permease subunit
VTGEGITGLSRLELTLTTGIALVIVVVLSSLLFLSAAGVFSLISFNVTRRRREIGIRSAPGPAACFSA